MSNVSSKTKLTSLRLPLADHAALVAEADARGWKQSAVIIQALRAWLPASLYSPTPPKDAAQ